MTADEQAIYRKAIMAWGKNIQILMAIEEFSELTKELVHSIRGRNKTIDVWEELADAEIMLEQMKIIFGFNEKLKRTNFLD